MISIHQRIIWHYSNCFTDNCNFNNYSLLQYHNITTETDLFGFIYKNSYHVDITTNKNNYKNNNKNNYYYYYINNKTRKNQKQQLQQQQTNNKQQ